MALITTPGNLDYLITPLRLHISDDTPPYTYNSDNLRTRLVYAVKALQSRWNNKYFINTSNDVERNSNTTYLVSSPPVIQTSDERAIILQAAIGIKSAFLYNTSSNYSSWKDDEISVSNANVGQLYEASLKRDIEELNSLLPVAGKRLAGALKQSLVGFQEDYNTYEG